ncbi:unnamed protein product [Mesocestoides corti]|uniref:Secreted protein n=1 Tax=Mesocestoides corti TaxID=53468 RepID=A0A0R3UAG3_MESCO|nr:unnamed protein product [Mesocestoides corti]
MRPSTSLCLSVLLHLPLLLLLLLLLLSPMRTAAGSDEAMLRGPVAGQFEMPGVKPVADVRSTFKSNDLSNYDLFTPAWLRQWRLQQKKWTPRPKYTLRPVTPRTVKY